MRRRKAREWDDVLAQVRMLDGFEHFLTATPYAELAAVAAERASSDRQREPSRLPRPDRGRRQPSDVRVVNLPGMSLDAAVDQANAMLEALAGAADPGRGFPDREKDRHAILDVLDWLWDVIAEPVLTALGHTSTPGTGSPWPRVWWCPTGPLTVMPIHAAGHHPRLRTAAADSIDCVLDRVISSYTPTLTALARSRQPQRPPRAATDRRHAHHPRPSPLPAVPAELKVLARHFPPGEVNHQLAGSQATRAAVLAAIATHSWVHLACHASQQHADPDPQRLRALGRHTDDRRPGRAPTQQPGPGVPICLPDRHRQRRATSTRRSTSPPPCSSSATGTSSPPCGLSLTRPRHTSPTPFTAHSLWVARQTPTEPLRHSTVPSALYEIGSVKRLRILSSGNFIFSIVRA